MPWIVYETTNKLNGKRYVGVHKQDGEEFDGYLGSGKYLANSIKKHGASVFERVTLFSFNDERDAYAKESEIVTEYWCSRSDTYNVKTGGSGGFPNNDPEFRAKHSKQMRAMHADPEFKAKHSERIRALNADPEFKAKHSERMRALNADPKFKAKRSEGARQAMRARHADPEFKTKHSERARQAMRARHADPEFKTKHSERMRARHADPEFKAKHSERMRALNADPEFKAKNSERMRARHADPEFKAKQLAGIQSRCQSRRREKANALLSILDTPATEGHHVSQIPSPQARRLS